MIGGNIDLSPTSIQPFTSNPSRFPKCHFKDHKCVVCAKEYTSKQALDTHMKVFHGDYDPKKGKITSHVEDDDDFQCDVCGKRYSNQAGFHASHDNESLSMNHCQ